MQNFASRTEATRDDWMTPKGIVDSLGVFDLDPCASSLDPTRLATAGFTEAMDGLTQVWHGRVWLNPPYGDATREWIKKLARHPNGIALIPPRVGSKWFHKEVLETCDAVLFLKGRIAFIDPSTMKPVKGNNVDSILVAFGAGNVQALKNCGLQGKLWVI